MAKNSGKKWDIKSLFIGFVAGALVLAIVGVMLGMYGQSDYSTKSNIGFKL